MHLPQVHQPPRSPQRPHQTSSVPPGAPSLKPTACATRNCDSKWILNPFLAIDNPAPPANWQCPVCHHQIHQTVPTQKVSATTNPKPKRLRNITSLKQSKQVATAERYHRGIASLPLQFSETRAAGTYRKFR